jgi:hypothetical protein
MIVPMRAAKGEAVDYVLSLSAVANLIMARAPAGIRELSLCSSASKLNQYSSLSRLLSRLS